MSDEEVDELLKAVDTSSGEINYTGILRPDPHCYDFSFRNFSLAYPGLLPINR